MTIDNQEEISAHTWVKGGKKILWVECECGHAEHSIRITHFNDNQEVFVEYFLHQHYTFWQRLVLAVKYVFGYASQYGHFGETIVKFDSDLAREIAAMFVGEPKTIPSDNDANTYFPMLIRYEGGRKDVVVNQPADIEPGKGFKVLKTRYEG